MGPRVVLLTVLFAFTLIPRVATGQTVELLYTPAVVRDVVTLKESLKVTLVHASNALSLVGATAERKRTYGQNLASATAVVIVGEDALKAAADIEFSSLVILVNASGPTAATGQVVRVFEPASAPPGAIAVGPSSVVNIKGPVKEVVLTGQVNAVVQAVIAGLR